VPATRAVGDPDLPFPRRSVANSDIQKIEFRIVDNRIPNRATTGGEPPLSGPGFGGHLKGWRLERLRGISGHSVETPEEIPVAAWSARPPHRFTGLCVQRDQTTVQRANVDGVAPPRDTAVDYVAASPAGDRARHFGVVAPQLLSGGGIECIDDAPRTGDIHDAIDNQWSRFNAAFSFDVEISGQAKFFGVVCVYFVERTVALFQIRASM
jgi:hypothetical protein